MTAFSSSHPARGLADTMVLTTRNRLRVRPLWYNGLRCGQAFLNPHEGTLAYHIVPHDRYASFIDTGPLRIDLDSSGFPIFVDLELAQLRARTVGTLAPPAVKYLQRHRFLDFPIQHRSPRLIVDHSNGLYHIVLSRRTPVECWAFAPGSVWEVDQDMCLVGIWLGSPVVDPSGCKQAAWRAGVWRAYRQGRLAEIESPASHLEHGWLSAPKIFP